MAERNFFVIPERLPGYNEQANEDRRSPQAGARMRRETEERIAWYIRAAMGKGTCWRIEHPCILRITWCEHHGKRDIDNVIFAKKYILDAMQLTRILPDDSQRWVRGFVEEYRPGAKDRITVEIEEDDDGTA